VIIYLEKEMPNEDKEKSASEKEVFMPPARQRPAQPLAETFQAPVLTPAVQMLNMVEKVMMTPDIPLERIEMAIKMKNDMENREYEKLFYADLASMQVELPRVIKSKKGHNSLYAPLEDINDAIRPAMQRHGFAVTFRVSQPEGRIRVETVLSHKAGHYISTEVTLDPDTSGSKNGVQAVASSISYGKRIGVTALLNISTGDDTDGADLGPQTIGEDQSRQPEISDKALDWVAKANACSTSEELAVVYKAGWADLKGDGLGRDTFMKAKETVKKALSK
jgi:hypothetical protein